MKKILVLLICFVLTGCLCACQKDNKPDVQNTGNIKIVTTIFPEYDWVMNILGDNPADVEVLMLLNSGVDLHSYEPTAQDIMEISTCDLFIYVGGESDEWVDRVLESSGNNKMEVINLLEVLGDAVKQEEIIEGMEHEEHEEHEEHGGEEEAEYDEHVWLSLRNAATLVTCISEKIQKIDHTNKDVYAGNAEAYVRKLKELDEKYIAAVANANTKTLLFGDRFPFRYLVDDYGLSYYAAFAGCSAESEASFETISFLARKVDELALSCVITIEGTDHRIAETIIQNTASKNQHILVLDSMQSITSRDVMQGTTYLSIMEKNLQTLKDALK